MTIFLKYYRLFFSLLALSAIVTEIATLIERGTFAPINFFSYFTIESNLIGLVILLLYSYSVHSSVKQSLPVQLLRGGATLYMVMTGIIFITLLAGLENTTFTAVPWDNLVLHYIMPLVLLVDWLLDPPKIRITLQHTWVWLVFPLVYVVYSLIRGFATSWYPYPFLNYSKTEPFAFFTTMLILTLGVIVASWLLCQVTRLRNK